MDRAVADVDENFAASYELRRRHRQVLAISSFFIYLDSQTNACRSRQIADSLSGMCLP
jgi:hypothetical protein